MQTHKNKVVLFHGNISLAAAVKQAVDLASNCLEVLLFTVAALASWTHYHITVYRA